MRESSFRLYCVFKVLVDSKIFAKSAIFYSFLRQIRSIINRVSKIREGKNYSNIDENAEKGQCFYSQTDSKNLKYV